MQIQRHVESSLYVSRLCLGVQWFHVSGPSNPWKTLAKPKIFKEKLAKHCYSPKEPTKTNIPEAIGWREPGGQRSEIHISRLCLGFQWLSCHRSLGSLKKLSKTNDIHWKACQTLLFTKKTKKQIFQGQLAGLASPQLILL